MPRTLLWQITLRVTIITAVAILPADLAVRMNTSTLVITINIHNRIHIATRAPIDRTIPGLDRPRRYLMVIIHVRIITVNTHQPPESSLLEEVVLDLP
mmetsp:Transcript_23311/g.49227  ORF Transcript_23311/g.49227 Transcript_23311/m.49227 type:complete len:98 (-) Transcript_23311:230-523(-)